MAFNGENNNQANPMSSTRRPVPDGILKCYVQHHAHPNAGGWRELEKLSDRITNILDRVAITLRGNPSSRKKSETLEPIEDLYAKEYYEQFMVNNHELVVSIGFTSAMVLRLAITDITPRPVKTEEPNPLSSPGKVSQANGDNIYGRFMPDSIFGIRDKRQPEHGFAGVDFMSCDDYHFTISAIVRPIQTFAGMNKLGFYVQGTASEDRLVYIFIDDDSVEI